MVSLKTQDMLVSNVSIQVPLQCAVYLICAFVSDSHILCENKFNALARNYRSLCLPQNNKKILLFNSQF